MNVSINKMQFACAEETVQIWSHIHLPELCIIITMTWCCNTVLGTPIGVDYVIQPVIGHAPIMLLILSLILS